MVCVHTYSEPDNAFQRHLKFFKMAAGHHLGFDPSPTGNGAIRSENPSLEPNMKGIGRRVAELWLFEIFPKCVNGP